MSTYLTADTIRALREGRGDSRTAPAAGRGPLPAVPGVDLIRRRDAGPCRRRLPPRGAPSRSGRPVPRAAGSAPGTPGALEPGPFRAPRRGDILAPCASAHGHLRQMEPP